MTDTMEPGLFHKILTTPLTDLVRGRITGPVPPKPKRLARRLRVKVRIETANLPGPAKALIGRVVWRTRLWPGEKLDVADELIAHFADGLESGESVEQLIQDFGDERRAAKLIRRGKKRNRPLLWHALRGLGWAIAALLIFYLGLAGYFLLGRPTPRINYIQLINGRTDQTPQDQLGWPVYRRAILAVGPVNFGGGELDKLLFPKPGVESLLKVESTPELTRWLRENVAAVELLRQAARKPTLGFLLGPDGSVNDPELWPGRTRKSWEDVSDDMLMSVLLPHLGTMRTAAKILAADACLARSDGDRQQWFADIDALIGMAGQLRDHEFLVCDLVSMTVRFMLLQEIEQTLIDDARFLSDTDLQLIAHRLAKPDNVADLISFRGERMSFHDVVQRTYTDNGRGDGRLTPAGVRLLQNIGRIGTDKDKELVGHMVVGSAAVLVAPSRHEVLAEFDRLLDMGEAKLSRPVREADWTAYNQQAARVKDSLLARVDCDLLSVLLPSLSHAPQEAERYLGRRDGILTALALELYRRHHGAYPDTLSQVTPDLLPIVPTDRITGQPTHYRLSEGRPVVYSIGADRKDDGGHAPMGPDGKPINRRAADWTISPDKAPSGDWVLYPQP